MYYVLAILPIITYIVCIVLICKSKHFKDSNKKLIAMVIFMSSTAVIFAIAEALYIKLKLNDYSARNILIISIMTLLNMLCIFLKSMQVIKLLKKQPLLEDNSLSIVPKMTSVELLGVVGFVIMMLLFK